MVEVWSVDTVVAVAAVVFSIVLAAMIGRAGWIKLTRSLASLAGSGLVWVSDVPRLALRGIGALEIAAAVVLATAPIIALTPFVVAPVRVLGIAAALGVACLMVAAHLFHLRRQEADRTWMATLAFGSLALLSAVSQFVSG